MHRRLHHAEPHTLSSGTLPSPYSNRIAPVLHLLLALHHGSSFTSSLLPSHCRRRHTTRYYAFISKYLDFTDLLLLLLRRRLVAFTTLQPFRSCFFLPPLLSCAHTIPLSLLTLCLFLGCCCRSLHLTLSLSLSLHFTLLLFLDCAHRSLLHFFDSTLPLRTCQSRAAVAATQILDTQYPSCAGRHFFTPEPESGDDSDAGGVSIPPKDPLRCTETAQKYGMPRLVGFSFQSLFQLLPKETSTSTQHPTRPL